MKQQVFVMHGANSFLEYDDYINYLKTVEIDPYKVSSSGWKEGLAAELGEGYEIFRPLMPNTKNAKYEEWKIWFEKYIEYFHDDIILVGHSLGAMFFLRYLSENDLGIRVKALYLVAGAVIQDGLDGEDCEYFYPKDIEHYQFETDIDRVTVYHSVDDFCVPYHNAVRIGEMIPGTEMISFEDRGHFSQETFPELVDHIKSLT